jgi:FtsH-binding integral membrane protein
MEPQNNPFPVTQPATTSVLAQLGVFTSQVFGWMTLGLFATAAVAIAISTNLSLFEFFIDNSWILLISFLAELGIVVAISGFIHKLSGAVAATLFTIYAILNGIFLSAIFIAYSPTTIGIAFAVTAGTFATMAAFGYVTKVDLTRWGQLALMTLIGVIIASIANLITRSDVVTWVLTYVSLGVFIVLTAYDTQKIKHYAAAAEQDGQYTRYAILAALSLYLDFINLFLLILRILGKSRN